MTAAIEMSSPTPKSSKYDDEATQTALEDLGLKQDPADQSSKDAIAGASTTEDSGDIAQAEAPCSACGWKESQKESTHYESHVKLFYAVSRRGAWSLGTKYILKERNAAPPNFEIANIEFLRLGKREGTDGYFELVSRLPGQTLEEAWPSLSEEDIERIAKQVAAHVAQMRRLTSETMESLDCQPLYSAWLFDTPYAPHGPFKSDAAFIDELIKILPNSSPDTASELRRHAPACEPYTFTHGDLAAVNIIVDDGNLSGIIDFENSGYYPVWWEVVKCSVDFSQADAAWKKALLKELPKYEDACQWWKSRHMLRRDPQSREALDVLDKLPVTG